jgi:hypothetical protein
VAADDWFKISLTALPRGRRVDGLSVMAVPSGVWLELKVA